LNVGVTQPQRTSRSKESTMSITQDSPTAAGSGASASESFKASQERRGAADTSPERVSTIVSAVLKGVHAAISDNDVTYPEFQAAKAWLMEVGETGEWPCSWM